MVRIALAALVTLAAAGSHVQGTVPVLDGTLPPPESVKGDSCNVGRVQSPAWVRAGPGRPYRAVDKLGRGTTVYVCNETALWYGIAYRGPGRECGGATLLGLNVRLSTGCRTGWVPKHTLEILTG
jgi:hypothetical protein